MCSQLVWRLVHGMAALVHMYEYFGSAFNCTRCALVSTTKLDHIPYVQRLLIFVVLEYIYKKIYNTLLINFIVALAQSC